MRVFQRATCLGTSLLLFSLTACNNSQSTDLSKSSILRIDLKELIRDPKKYQGKEIRISGHPEYIGDKDYSHPELPSNVVFTTHRLHTLVDSNSPHFTITEIDGGLYLPIPPSSSRILYRDKIEVRGLVKVNEGNPSYYLQVNFAQKVNE